MLNAFVAASLVSSTKGASLFSLGNTFYLDTKKTTPLNFKLIIGPNTWGLIFGSAYP